MNLTDLRTNYVILPFDLKGINHTYAYTMLSLRVYFMDKPIPLIKPELHTYALNFEHELNTNPHEFKIKKSFGGSLDLSRLFIPFYREMMQ